MFTLKRVNATIEDPLRVPRLAQPETPERPTPVWLPGGRSRLLAGCDSGVSAGTGPLALFGACSSRYT